LQLVASIATRFLLHDPPGFDVCRQPADRVHLGFRHQLLIDILRRTRSAVPHDTLGILHVNSGLLKPGRA